MMGKIKTLTGFIIILLLASVNIRASETDITITEFRQLYDNLLAGKTLVTSSQEDGMDVVKERKFGQAVGVGGNDFEVLTEAVISKSRDGVPVESIKISILDRINDLGGQPVIYEEARNMEVESTGAQSRDTGEIEFMGLFRVSKNDKGGFDVHNFGLTPSVIVDGSTNKIAGSNLSYSCYPENGLTKCVLTIRDYHLGPYTPLVGYRLMKPVGGDLVEISEEMKK
jgi:hypothetical protein